MGREDSNRNLGTVNIDEIDNEIRIRPSDDIQSRLDALNTESGRVGQPKWFLAKLDPNTEYTTDVTVDIPEYTILDLNGAKLKPSGDFTIVRQGSPGAILAGYGQSRITAGGVTLTNPAVLWDTSDFNNNLNTRFDNTMGIIGHPEIVTGFGDGIGLKLDSAGQQILDGNRVEVKISGPEDHIVLDTNNGNSINAVSMDVQLSKWCTGKNIVHRSTGGNPGEAYVNITGEIQTDSNATHAIHNETGVGRSIHFKGQIADPTNPTTAAIAGDYVRADLSTNMPQSAVNFGTGTTVNQMSYQALGGASPSASDYIVGDEVQDADNPNTLYKLQPDESWKSY